MMIKNKNTAGCPAVILFVDKYKLSFFIGQFSALAFGQIGVKMQRANLNSAKLLNVVADCGKHSFDLMIFALSDSDSACGQALGGDKGFNLCG